MNWDEALERGRTDAGTFGAKFSSRPPCCDQPLEVGDEAKWAGGRVVHAGCELVDEGALRPGEVCPRCFTERAVNGSCACEED